LSLSLEMGRAATTPSEEARSFSGRGARAGAGTSRRSVTHQNVLAIDLRYRDGDGLFGIIEADAMLVSAVPEQHLGLPARVPLLDGLVEIRRVDARVGGAV
jgi:hypothetical protein